MTAIKTCVRYLRFSSEGQSNSSIEWQDTSTAHWCERNNVSIKDTFIDAGYSAKTFNRPDFKELYDFLATHYRAIDFLVVNQLDRFSRDAGEALSMVKKLQVKFGVQIVSVTEGITYDHQTPGSFFRAGLQLILAEDDNINRSQKINSGIYTSKAREGRFIGGTAPYGYQKVGEKKDRHLEIFADEAVIVQFIFKNYQAHMPIMEIYKKAIELGLKKRGNSVIPKILTNPIYSGQQLVKPWKDMPGGLMPGIHTAIIDVITWQQVQWQLKGTLKNKVSISDEMELRGVLHCFCGRMLTGAPSRGRHGGYYYYYKCHTPKHNNINAKKAHLQLQEMLGYMSVPSYILDAIKTSSQKEVEIRLKDNKKNLYTNKRALEEITLTMISLEEKWINNQINFETYNRWHNDTLQKRVFIKATIDKLSKDESETYALLQENLYSLTDLQFLYNNATINNKQELLKKGFDSSLYYQNGIYRTPFLMDIFSHNSLILNQKKLLIIDEKRGISTILPTGGAAGSRTLVQTHSP